MSVDLKDLETTPTLSLDPFGEAEKEPEVPAAPKTHLPLRHHRRRYGYLRFIRPFIMTLYIILSK